MVGLLSAKVARRKLSACKSAYYWPLYPPWPRACLSTMIMQITSTPSWGWWLSGNVLIAGQVSRVQVPAGPLTNA